VGSENIKKKEKVEQSYFWLGRQKKHTPKKRERTRKALYDKIAIRYVTIMWPATLYKNVGLLKKEWLTMVDHQLKETEVNLYRQESNIRLWRQNQEVARKKKYFINYYTLLIQFLNKTTPVKLEKLKKGVKLDPKDPKTKRLLRVRRKKKRIQAKKEEREAIKATFQSELFRTEVGLKTLAYKVKTNTLNNQLRKKTFQWEKILPTLPVNGSFGNKNLKGQDSKWKRKEVEKESPQLNKNRLKYGNEKNWYYALGAWNTWGDIQTSKKTLDSWWLKRKKIISDQKEYLLGWWIHVQMTFNNTIATVTDLYGNTFFQRSAGQLQFKKARRSSAVAATQVGEEIGLWIAFQQDQLAHPDVENLEEALGFSLEGTALRPQIKEPKAKKPTETPQNQKFKGKRNFFPNKKKPMFFLNPIAKTLRVFKNKDFTFISNLIKKREKRFFFQQFEERDWIIAALKKPEKEEPLSDSDLDVATTENNFMVAQENFDRRWRWLQTVRQVEKVHVYFNGVSRNRAPFLKGLMQINCPIYIIWEGTRRPHNGCRLPKKRRR
jgi:ribosomal protein S11